MEAELEAEENPVSHRTLLDAYPVALVYTDLGDKIVETNLAACRWFGLDHADLLGEKLSPLLTVPVPVTVTRHPVNQSDGRRGWLCSLTHKTEQTRAKPVGNLAERLEVERIRLARELHDGALQELIAVGFGLADLHRKLASNNLSANQNSVSHWQQEVLRVARLLRNVVSELRPPGLEEFGLAEAIRGLATKLARDLEAPLDLALDLEEVPGLSLSQQLCLYRGAQEAIHNCLRHAQADRLVVVLLRLKSGAELTIEDDGCGFEVPTPLSILTRTEHYGLAGMAERIDLAQGTLGLFSAPGRGTRVTLTIPNDLEEKWNSED